MKTRTKRLAAVLLVALAAVLAIGLAWLFPPPGHYLLAKSVPVPGLHPGHQKDEYYWLSDHQLLLFHPVHDRHWTVVCRNLRAPTEKSLPALERLFQQTGGDPWSVTISPDHTRLIWAGIGRVIYGATLDGQQFQRWPYGKDEIHISYWLNDSRHFLRYREVASQPLPLIMRSVDDQKSVKYVPEVNSTVPPGWTLPQPFPASKRVCVEESSNNILIIILFTAAKVQRIVKGMPLLPGDGNEYPPDQRFISDGSAMIWTTSRLPPPRTPAFFWGLLDRLGWRPEPYKTVRVSVSRADGTQQQFVGDWEEPRYGSSDVDQYPHNFRWLPGHKRLSFERLGALCVVPVGP